MPDRDRLIELLDIIIQPGQKTLGDIADYLLANGVIVPPCKLGDKVYLITLDKTVEEYTVNGVCHYTNGIFVELIDFDRIFDIPAHKVFLTKKQAEEKLKELGK